LFPKELLTKVYKGTDLLGSIDNSCIEKERMSI